MFKNKKKITSIMLLGLILISFPLQSLASGILQEYYPPSDSDFYQKRITYQYYNSPGVTQIVITQYEYPGNTKVIGTKEFTVKENSNIWIDYTCKGQALIEWKDSTGAVKDWLIRSETDNYLEQGDCSNIANLSNYNEELKQYADDTFGASKPAPGTPPQDGSGGGSNTDPGGGDGGDGGTDPTAPPPYWEEHMDKMDEIISKIPPPPNWDEISDQFADKIGSQVKEDLGDLLGSAPEPPAAPMYPGTPSDSDNLNDGGFKSKTPTGTEAPGLGEAGFTSDDIKAEAPEIPERSDPNTGGFKIDDPLGGLPSQEEFMENLPTEPEDAAVPAAPNDPDNPAPAAPEEQDNQAPTPNDPGAEAPTPSDDGASAPIPGDDGASAPIPTEEGNAPIPGDSGANAPIPSPGNETAPIPGQP
jgi:hypothetical protein